MANPLEDQIIKAWQALQPLMDLMPPMALRVAATLRLADLMPDDGAEAADQPGAADEPSAGIAIADLASRARANPDALARMLRYLVHHGVFSEPRPGEFAVNRTAALLRSGQPGHTWLDLDGFGGQMDMAFTGLAHTVRTGEAAWEQVFGLPLWAYLDANPAIAASHDALMASFGSVGDLADGYDWARVRRVTDVGGGTGALLGQILLRHPWLRGTLVDLPDTASRAREHLAGLDLGDRCEIVGQSFFDPIPPGADAYLLNRVIHDWDDTSARVILRRCAEAAGETGRVLVIESHGIKGENPALLARDDLRMLVVAGGHERGIDDYSALATSAGLQVMAVHRVTERHLIIECAVAQQQMPSHSTTNP